MSVTPQFIGQRYKDTNTGNIWKSNSLTPGDWTLELQNAKLGWLPDSAVWQNSRGVYLTSNLPGLTDLIDYTAHTLDGYHIAQTGPILKTFSAPNLIDIDPLNGPYGVECYFDSNSGLTLIDMPLFSVTGYHISITNNPVLATANMPSLVNSAGGITMTNNPLLVSVPMSSLALNNNTAYDFSGCALNVATVNLLLARGAASAAFQSGTLDLSLGTSHAPTGQGIIDKGIINARLPGLAVTN